MTVITCNQKYIQAVLPGGIIWTNSILIAHYFTQEQASALIKKHKAVWRAIQL